MHGVIKNAKDFNLIDDVNEEHYYNDE